MINLISRTINYIKFLFQGVQVKPFLAVVLVGLMTLTTNVAFGENNQVLKEKVRQDIQQDDSQRPKTIREWNREARETEGSPGKRLQKIGEESAEAFKEFGSGYVEGAKKTARDIQNGASELGE
ncbi:hypothetical protein [Nodularia sphaerocarpa]|uniref:hypothetical protein n=1 Tax=Nodularia sphaerocarpa TaxID=137816 RepID=UPI001EFAC32F|nr:hypothetical protein [Nodularia sphaerocarpa]MDB9372234.1 hypothetical protein [Nodularia sphaerocarpa CS-585]MDB9378142.1 hypothetical protein [Nodularia sphaerocarpa CS-585A2]ULP74599.1 hypothetical protein BDGGKGIB_04268 [Nodularia sphaerocarpa UHCC 0038]